MLKDIVTKFLEEEIKKESKAQIDKKNAELNDKIAEVIEAFELDPKVATLDDVIIKCEEDGDFDFFPELKTFFELLVKSKNRLETYVFGTQADTKKIIEIMTDQYNAVLSLEPDTKDELVSRIIEQYTNPSQEVNVLLENGTLHKNSLGIKQLIITEATYEIQKYINDLDITEEEFLNSPDAINIIREVIAKHRNVGHILAIISINNWDVDFRKTVIDNSDISPELALSTIKDYGITKAEYELIEFDEKINNVKYLAECLNIPVEDKMKILTVINGSILTKEQQCSSEFYQSKVGDNLSVGFGSC